MTWPNFKRMLIFRECVFKTSPHSVRQNLKKNAYFSSAKFQGDNWFQFLDAEFQGDVTFLNAHFTGLVHFGGAKFKKKGYF